MTLSNKLFFATCALCLAVLVAEKVALRASFNKREKLDFEPGMVEKPVGRFRAVVVDTRLAPNSELRISKGERFAVSSDANFWASAEVVMRGDTLFIRQTTDKRGKLSDPADRSVNDYANIYALCPSGLSLVRADIGVVLDGIAADSLSIEQSPSHLRPDFAKHGCDLKLKNARLGSLKISTGQNAKVEVDEKCAVGELRLVLRDSSSAEVKAPVSNAIRLDCSGKSRLSLVGDNWTKVKN